MSTQSSYAAAPLAEVSALLPTAGPVQLIDPDATASTHGGDLRMPPSDGVLQRLHRHMVIGRRFDTQATALTRNAGLLDDDNADRLHRMPRPTPQTCATA